MNQTTTEQGPAPEQTLRKLGEVRRGLLHLHKVLLDIERNAYEQVHGRVSSGELLQLVINHEQFAWLRPVSELVVRIDELLEPAQPATEEDALGALREAGALVRPARGVGEFGRRYQEAIQNSPDVVLAHGALAKILHPVIGREGMTEAEIDNNLAGTFPASDPPSWTLGTDHGASEPDGRD